MFENINTNIVDLEALRLVVGKVVVTNVYTNDTYYYKAPIEANEGAGYMFTFATLGNLDLFFNDSQEWVDSFNEIGYHFEKISDIYQEITEEEYSILMEKNLMERENAQ